MATIVRRRKLGMSSAKGIVDASQQGIQWCRHDKGVPNDNVYIRWGCTAMLPNPQATVLNKSAAISEVNDKLAFRRKLNDHALCPKTWFSTHEYCEANHAYGYNARIRPVVIRPPKHAQGRNLVVCRSVGEVTDTCAKYRRLFGGYYISKLIEKVEEIRVFVVQGRAVAVAKKTPANPNEVAWNVAKGGRFDNLKWDEWNVNAVDTAIKAFNLSRLDFGGVDVMIDVNGNATVLEINSAPSLTSPYRQQCMAKALDYMIANGNERLRYVDKPKKYRHVIHPCITDKAEGL